MSTEVSYLTTAEVAAKARVASSTVRRWVESGDLKPAMRLPGGHYRFAGVDVDALLTPVSPIAPSSAAPRPDEGASSLSAAS